jgi:putative ABC transport system permease protein
MPDGAWVRLLGRLLPTRTRRDLFEPALLDLRIANLRRGGARGTAPIRTLGLFFECWRLQLSELLRSRHSSSPIPAPRKERLSMFLYHLRHAFRLLWREPSFTLAALLTLALGVGANVAVFAVVEAVLLSPLPYRDAGRLVILNHRDTKTGIAKEYIAIGDYVDITQRQSSFQSLGGYGNQQVTVSGLGDPFRVSTLYATPGLLETLGVHPALGRLLQANDGRKGATPVVVLGYEMWQNRFASDPHIVGRGVKVGPVEWQVIGVAPPGFRFPPNTPTELIAPMAMPLQAPAARKSDWTLAVARLKPNGTVQQANANLASISSHLAKEYPQSNQASEYFAVSLRDALVGNTKPALVLMLAAVSVVLLIACVNVANLLLARSLARRREMAVRTALGAGRGRLILQLLSESLALALIAGCLGVAIASWGSRALVALVPKSVSVPGLAEVHINRGALAFSLGISVITAIAFSLVSAFTLKGESASGALVAPTRVTMGARARRAASALVVAEVALAIVLLIGAGLILRSFSRLLAVDPGFRTDRLMTMDIQIPADRYRAPAAQRAFYDRAFAELKSLPLVREAGAAVVVPLTGNNWTTSFERADQPATPGERPPEVGWQLASEGYFKALRIPLLAGRLFNAQDTENTKPVVLISEAIQRRFFSHEPAVGREIKMGKARMEIVGVVGNIRRAGLRDEPRADMYFAFEANPSNQITLFIRTATEPTSALSALQAALHNIEPNIVVTSSRSMEDVVNESVQVTHLMLWLLGVFAATALALSAVGIYGVMSYVVRQRTREIGTRVALGATSHDILWMVMRQGAVIAGLGAAIGLAAGLAAARLLNSILYGISASDPLTLAGAAVLLIATTMAACYLPARRASHVDPARTLSEQ